MESDQNYKIFTYQARVHIDATTADGLEQCASFFSHLEHLLFKDLSTGKKATDLKSGYIKKHCITARHFNALRVQLEGKISSIRERQPQRIAELELKIQAVTKTIQKLKKSEPHSNKLHQKKRSLFNLQQKLQRLKQDRKEEKVSLCFGSKRLFHAQFDLAANGYQSHAEWLSDWRKNRDSSFFLLGSKDETGGNQSCTATLSSDGSITLRIRLPDCLSSVHGKYLLIPAIRFQYGHEEIVKSLQSCIERKKRQSQGDQSYKNYGQPISYRFKSDQKGWRLFVSTPSPSASPITSTQKGVIGVDINANQLALTETDRYGNPIRKETIKLNTYGKNQNQTKALIGNACAAIISQAEQTGKTVVLEKLDFQKKKTQLKEENYSAQARMLSGFAYSSIKNHLHSRGWKKGVTITEVNPAYTSLIGRVKFAKRYGLSIHHSAALAIGRRYLKASERVPRHLEFIPDGKSGHVALSLPVRNRDEHVWSQWRILQRRLKTVLAAHFRAIRNRSLSSKTAPETRHPEYCRRNSGT